MPVSAVFIGRVRFSAGELTRSSSFIVPSARIFTLPSLTSDASTGHTISIFFGSVGIGPVGAAMRALAGFGV